MYQKTYNMACKQGRNFLVFMLLRQISFGYLIPHHTKHIKMHPYAPFNIIYIYVKVGFSWLVNTLHFVDISLNMYNFNFIILFKYCGQYIYFSQVSNNSMSLWKAQWPSGDVPMGLLNNLVLWPLWVILHHHCGEPSSPRSKSDHLLMQPDKRS